MRFSLLVVLTLVVACGGRAESFESEELSEVVFYDEATAEELEVIELETPVITTEALEETSDTFEHCSPVGGLKRVGRDHVAICREDGYWEVNIKKPSPQGKPIEE